MIAEDEKGEDVYCFLGSQFSDDPDTKCSNTNCYRLWAKKCAENNHLCGEDVFCQFHSTHVNHKKAHPEKFPNPLSENTMVWALYRGIIIHF